MQALQNKESQHLVQLASFPSEQEKDDSEIILGKSMVEYHWFLQYEEIMQKLSMISSVSFVNFAFKCDSLSLFLHCSLRTLGNMS